MAVVWLMHQPDSQNWVQVPPVFNADVLYSADNHWCQGDSFAEIWAVNESGKGVAIATIYHGHFSYQGRSIHFAYTDFNQNGRMDNGDLLDLRLDDPHSPFKGFFQLSRGAWNYLWGTLDPLELNNFGIDLDEVTPEIESAYYSARVAYEALDWRGLEEGFQGSEIVD